MSDLRIEIIKKINPPQAGEVYWLPDEEIFLPEKNRKEHVKRPCIVVSSNDLLKPPCDFIFIVPLSTAGKADTYRFPLAKSSYERIVNKFDTDLNRFALVNMYQPLDSKYLGEKCCRIDATAYEAIMFLICTKVVGFSKFQMD